MTRRLLTIASVAGALLAVPALAAAGTQQIVPVSSLPTKGARHVYVVSAVGGAIDPNTLEVTENGHAVRNLTVRLSQAPLALAIVVDASNSMRGKPLATALSAAGSIVGGLPANVAASVYAFNAQTQVVAPFGAPRAGIAAALAKVTTAEGTNLYDAVDRASRDLLGQKVGTRVMIVASDGADTGSTTSLATVTDAARTAGLRVFTIGLAGKGFDRSSLEGLAVRTGGTFSTAADAASLAALQSRVAGSLVRQYVVSFDSELTAPGARAKTEISAPGFRSATVAYAIPTVRVIAVKAGFWSTRWAHVGIVAVAGLIVFLIALLLLRPRKATLAERVGEYHMSVQARQSRESPFLDDLLERTEKRLANVDWARRLELQLDRANLAIRTGQFVLMAGAGALLLGVLFALLFRSPVAIAFGGFAPVGAWVFVNVKARKRVEAFSEQLPENLTILSQSLRAGYSLLQALDSVADNAAEPARTEFGRVIAQTRLGASVDGAMDELALRMESKDFSWVVAVVAVQAKIGGNMAEILDSVADTILSRQRMRREIKALTAQGRMTQAVLTALPPGVGLLIYVVNPSLMNEMLDRPIGIAVLAVAAAMTAIGSMIISKIVRIDI
jgi:tight adherence protein B